jgi:hypothetical protein
MLTKTLSQNSENDCVCNSPCKNIHWHNVTCGVCNGKKYIGNGRIKWRTCKECNEVGMLQTCCCGARVRLHPDAVYSCAIATATLGSRSETELDLLRTYRRQVFESNLLGIILSEYYDRIKFRVAGFIKNRVTLRTMFLYFFVKPGLWLTQRRLQNNSRLCGALAFLLVTIMLSWATILYVFACFFPKTT